MLQNLQKLISLSLLMLIVPTFIMAQQVAAGELHSIALTSDGTVYTWGYNGFGQLGNGNNTDSNVPVAVITSGVLSGKTITQVAAGKYHSIALASDGTVYTWGRNNEGELGNGNNTNSNVPVAVVTSGVLSGKTITQVAAGKYHSIALASDGTVYTWGRNNEGELGNGDNTNSNVPVA
jgi:alpha-tubulin suppressor-like RCC1 family protein